MAAHLADTHDRADEARGPRRIAARIWLDALEQFPHAAEYTSGVHGRHSDLDWYRKSFPGELTENAATPDEADNFRDTPFGRRATAATAFRQKDWQVALGEFARSAQIRNTDQTSDWVHVALCRGNLGHAVQARNYYEAAAEKIAAMENAPPDLLQIADEAKQLVDKLPMPESYYKFDRVFVEPDAHGLAAARQIRVGPDGNIYVASHDTDVVKVFAADTGSWLRDLATSSGELDGPWGMTFGPDGRLYVSGQWSRNIVRFDVSTGEYDVFVPSGNGKLGLGKGLEFGPDGHLYVASRVDDNVKRYNGTTGAYMGDFVAAGSGGLEGVTGITFAPDGNLYVASANTRSINVYDGTTGKFLKAFISGSSADLAVPILLEFRDDGFLYVACQLSREIKRFDPSSGKFEGLVVPTGIEPSGVLGLDGMAFDREGRLYVSIGTARGSTGHRGETLPSRVLRYAQVQLPN
jgi:sugar lactone lactonase YvrE